MIKCPNCSHEGQVLVWAKILVRMTENKEGDVETKQVVPEAFGWDYDPNSLATCPECGFDELPLRHFDRDWRTR